MGACFFVSPEWSLRDSSVASAFWFLIFLTSDLTFQARVAPEDAAAPVPRGHRRQLFPLDLRPSEPAVGLSRGRNTGDPISFNHGALQWAARCDSKHLNIDPTARFNDFIYTFEGKLNMMQEGGSRPWHWVKTWARWGCTRGIMCHLVHDARISSSEPQVLRSPYCSGSLVHFRRTTSAEHPHATQHEGNIEGK